MSIYGDLKTLPLTVFFYILIGPFKPEGFQRKLSTRCQLSHVAINRTVVSTVIREKNKQQLTTTDVSRKQFIQYTVDAKLCRNGVGCILDGFTHDHIKLSTRIPQRIHRRANTR